MIYFLDIFGQQACNGYHKVIFVEKWGCLESLIFCFDIDGDQGWYGDKTRSFGLIMDAECGGSMSVIIEKTSIFRCNGDHRWSW